MPDRFVPGPPDHGPDGPEPRPEEGLPDYHNPLSRIGGSPPARSALTLRLVLAIFGLILATAGAIVLGLAEAPVGFVILLVAIALVAAVNIAVVVRRKRRGEPG